ncbi:MAG: hypothetical protein SFU86_02140 [Pirellulaceae bacterium]|nr:hypothetical protein [Pirellulaceae bacterium]
MSKGAPQAALPTEPAPFQPGQLALRHLLGAMTVVGIIAGLSAAQIRGADRQRAWEIALHWILVTGIAGGTFLWSGIALRRWRVAAGPLLLRCGSVPQSSQRRRNIAALLTSLVILDGVFMSAFALPAGAFSMAWSTAPHIAVLMLFGQGLLFANCWSHWVADVFWVEFRWQGIVLPREYLPWTGVSRAVWSPTFHHRLVVLHRGRYHELAIDPAAAAEVTAVLDRLLPRESRVAS